MSDELIRTISYHMNIVEYTFRVPGVDCRKVKTLVKYGRYYVLATGSYRQQIEFVQGIDGVQIDGYYFRNIRHYIY